MGVMAHMAQGFMRTKWDSCHLASRVGWLWDLRGTKSADALVPYTEQCGALGPANSWMWNLQIECHHNTERLAWCLAHGTTLDNGDELLWQLLLLYPWGDPEYGLP